MGKLERIDAKLTIADLVKHERLLMEDLYDAYEIAHKQEIRKRYRTGIYWISSELTKYYNSNVIIKASEDSGYPFDIRVTDIPRKEFGRTHFIHAIININSILKNDNDFAANRESIYRLS